MRPSLLLARVARVLSGPGAPSAGQTLVAAVSGGPDSVALLDALAVLAPERGLRVVAAHLDHGLRPSAGEDAAFCEELCARLGVSLHLGVADVRARAAREGRGIEDAARQERYAFLRGVKERVSASTIVIAHTRDDQAETLLLRLLRGSGRRGLAGMRDRSGDLLRPLLTVSREDVLDHLRARGLAWREDPTNADPVYVRNRVRAELLPLLESRFNPAARETLARAAAVLAEEEVLLAEMADALWARVARREAGAVLLSRAELHEAPRALGRRVLRHALEETGGLEGVGHGHVEKLWTLAGAASGRRLPLPGRREAFVRFGHLRIGPRPAPLAPFAFDLPVPGRVELPGGRALLARPASGPASSEALAAVVPAPEGPLVVRTRQAGDRVGSGGREVSLKRFLLDRRVPADLRPGLPLVASGRHVVWVPGYSVAAAQKPSAASASEAGFIPAERAGGLGGAPLAPPSINYIRLELQGAEAPLR